MDLSKTKPWQAVLAGAVIGFCLAFWGRVFLEPYEYATYQGRTYRVHKLSGVREMGTEDGWMKTSRVVTAE